MSTKPPKKNIDAALSMRFQCAFNAVDFCAIHMQATATSPNAHMHTKPHV
jgi:hypothetical protein